MLFLKNGHLEHLKIYQNLMSQEKTVEKKLSRAAIETLVYYCLSSTCY